MVVALNPATGKVRWRRLTSARDWHDALTVVGDVVADVATRSAVFEPARAQGVRAAEPSAATVTRGPGRAIELQHTTVTAFAARSGHQLWRAAYADSETSVVGTTDALLVLHSNYPATTTLEALDPMTGARRWLAPLADGQQLTQNIAASPVDVTRTDNEVTGFDATTGAALWSSPSPADGAYAAGGTVFLTQAASVKNPVGKLRGIAMSAVQRTVSGVAVVLVLLVQSVPAAAAQPKARLVALSSVTGHQQWSVGLPTASASTPVLAGDTAMVSGTNDCQSNLATVVGLDTATGRTRWHTTVGSSNACSYGQTPFVAHGVALVGGPLLPQQVEPTACTTAATAGAPTSPVALSTTTGRVLWRAPLAFASSLGATGAVAIGTNVLGTCLVALDLSTGKLLWSRRAGVQIEAVLITPTGAVLWAQTQPAVQKLEGLNLATGKALWTRTLSKPNVSVQVIGGDVITVLSSPDVPAPGTPFDTTIATYDPTTGKALWHRGRL